MRVCVHVSVEWMNQQRLDLVINHLHVSRSRLPMLFHTIIILCERKRTISGVPDIETTWEGMGMRLHCTEGVCVCVHVCMCVW